MRVNFEKHETKKFNLDNKKLHIQIIEIIVFCKQEVTPVIIMSNNVGGE